MRVEVAVVQDGRLRVGAEVGVCEQLGHGIDAVALLGYLEHHRAGTIGPRDEHAVLAGVDGLRDGNDALPVGVGPQQLAAAWIESVDAAVSRCAPPATAPVIMTMISPATLTIDGVRIPECPRAPPTSI